MREYAQPTHNRLSQLQIIDKRDLSECWAEGLRSAIYKSGGKGVPENYRGITIFLVLEKVFDIAVYKRIGFVKEAFCKRLNIALQLRKGNAKPIRWALKSLFP